MECDIKEEVLDEDRGNKSQADVLNSDLNAPPIINDIELLRTQATSVEETDKTIDLDKSNGQNDGSETNNNDETSQEKKNGFNKPKRSMKFKLEIDININNVYNEEFDAFSDENSVFKKYRLRRKNKVAISDDIPTKHKKLNSDDEDSEVNRCDQCKKSFDSKTGLLNHLRIHGVPQKFICSLCDTDFETNAELLQHKEVHEAEKRSFMCVNCKVAFSDHCDYLVHEASHMKRLSYKCVECGMKCTKKDQFQNHIKTHFNKTTTCPICLQDIKDSYFQSHLRNHKSISECVECGKKCKPSSYAYHMSTHTGVKLHQCLYCGKRFANASQKIVHTRIHTDERPYECNVCNRWFKQSADLRRHMYSHETEKNISCTVCNKKFYHKESLNMHMRVHLNRDLFTCNICGEKTSSMTGLRSHTMYKHCDERPFKCETCDVSFKVKYQLTRHCRTRIHRNKLYGYMKKKNE